MAVVTPKIIPKKIANRIELIAKTKVSGKVSEITEFTDLPLFTKDSLKYGVLITTTDSETENKETKLYFSLDK